MQRSAQRPVLHRWLAGLFCLLLLSSGLLISGHTPPLLSPDEPAHVVRAYTLASGEWLLHNPPGQSTSAWVDPALADFLQVYRHRNRVAAGREPGPAPSAAALAVVADQPLGSAQPRHRSPAPGSAVYPPLAYLPQGLALGTCERLGCSAKAAYGLARLAALLTSVAVLWLAFSLVVPSPWSIALIALPMSLFQLASAALDGVSTSLAVLAISLFQVLPEAPPRSRGWMQLALLAAVLLVVPARLHLWPLLVLPLWCAWRLRLRWAWAPTLAVLSAVVAWVLVVSRLTVDLRRAGLRDSPLQAGLDLLTHPGAFGAVMGRTLTDPTQLQFYGRSFIGILGWLHLPLQPPQAYGVFAVLLLIAVLLSLVWLRPESLGVLLQPDRLLLVAMAVFSSVSVFVLLLLGWTPNPLHATLVEGVQGRYFLVPALMLGFAVAAPQRQLRKTSALRITYGFGALVLLISTAFTLQVL